MFRWLFSRRKMHRIGCDWAHSVYSLNEERDIGSLLAVGIEFRNVVDGRKLNIEMDGGVAESVASSILEELGKEGW